MTRDEHDQQHDMNEMTFWKQHRIDPFAIALELYQVSGDIKAGTKIIRDSIRRRRAGL